MVIENTAIFQHRVIVITQQSKSNTDMEVSQAGQELIPLLLGWGRGSVLSTLLTLYSSKYIV